MKPLKEEVNIPNIEKPPNEPKIGLFEIKNEKDFEQNSKTATLDPKISSVKSEIETFKKVKKLKKIFPTKNKMTPSDNSKPFLPLKTFYSSSSCSSSVENLNAFTKTSKASSETSAEIKTFKEAAKPAKTIISESCKDVSLQNLHKQMFILLNHLEFLLF